MIRALGGRHGRAADHPLDVHQREVHDAPYIAQNTKVGLMQHHCDGAAAASNKTRRSDAEAAAFACNERVSKRRATWREAAKGYQREADPRTDAENKTLHSYAERGDINAAGAVGRVAWSTKRYQPLDDF